MPDRPDNVVVGRGRQYAPLATYLGLCAALLAVAMLLPESGGRVVLVGMSCLGVLALAIGVRWQRPDVASGWWFLIAGLSVVSLTGVLLTITFTVRGEVSIGGAVPATTTLLSYPLILVGLVRLNRLSGHGGWSDVIDALLAAFVCFLVLWVGILQPIAERGSLRIIGPVLYPIGGLVAVAMLITLIASFGLRSPAIDLVVGGLALLFTAGLVLAIPALRGENLDQRPVVAGLLWIGYSIAIGAAGLHPSLGRLRRREISPTDRVTRWQLLLFGCVALLAPIAAGFEVRLNPNARNNSIGSTVALVASVALALLLCLRVAQLGRQAQQRADELASSTAALRRAVQAEQALQNQLLHRTLHDPLTGLANRLALAERIDWVLNRHSSAGRHGLVLLDLDGFKVVNDTYGRRVGDEVLVEVAHRLLNEVPGNATLARLSADEFAVLLEDTSPDTLRSWTEAARQALARPYRKQSGELFLTASAGVVALDRKTDPADTMRDADLAMHAAKESGGDRLTLFREDLRAARLDQARIAAGLRRALRDDDLHLLYQPVVDLSTGQIVGLEALLRWTANRQPTVPPDVFIPVAEETGLIRPIGEWVLHQACRTARPWFVQYGVSVAVNVSGRQLDDDSFADLVLGVLDDAGLPGEALVVEVTETTLVATAESRISQLARLRAHGVRVAIDDFGTGYSSMTSVAQLPADIIKVDKSFLRSRVPGGEMNEEDLAVARAVVQLANSLHLQTIAEGVETQAQADAMRSLRCGMAQGYLFARPLPPDQITRRLTRLPDLG